MKRFCLLALALLSGCNLSPRSQPPAMDVPLQFKEGWKLAQPADHQPRGAWWSAFHDAELNRLLQGVEVSNQSLQSAAARAENAAAILTSAKLSFLPTADAATGVTRSNNGSGGNVANLPGRSGIQDIRSVNGSVRWEIDVWGRIRHGAKAAQADAEAAQADVESMRLSLQTQAAQTYFSLRAADAQKQLLQGEVDSYQKSLGLTQNREQQGVASQADVAQAQTQLANARVALIEIDVQRATFEHALAALTGQAPNGFNVKAAALAAQAPKLPGTLSSTLLQRRPDIAAAERRVAAANERIGAAKAAFFPALSITGQTGWRGLADILTEANNLWSLGGALAQPLLDSGQRLVAKAQASATWKGSVADYRQTVLTALQETEDSLATLRILALAATAQEAAVRSARDSERIAKSQYEAGTVSYLNVIVAQATALNAERAAIDLRLRRLNATVALIKALGGSW